MRCRFPASVAWLLTALLVAACGSPPHKEMDQAQEANEAVTQRDYRLALNHALESREQAQNAARTAADTRARLRGDTERALAEVNTLIVQTRGRLSALTPARARRVRQQLTLFGEEVQKASKAIQAEDYDAAQRTLAAVKQAIQQILAAPPTGAAAQSSRRPQ